MCKKAVDIYEHHTIELTWKVRIGIISFLICFIALWTLSSYVDDQNKNVGDTNVYLNEEACFAGEIFVKVTSLNVDTIESEEIDSDGDALSSYVMNLGITIEQRHIDFFTNKVKFSPKCFALKSVNLKAKTLMSIFIESLAKATIAAALGAGIEGTINIIDETINFASEYTTESIENAELLNGDFKPIKSADDSFPSFYPYKIQGVTEISLSFPIKQEYLDSKNLIVLAIDDFLHWEKQIFLIVRPDD